MAQTKARAPSKRSRPAQKSQARSRGSSGKSTAVKDAGQAVGRAASRAKVPLVAGGAALAGAAGGLALGMHQGRRRNGIVAPHRPQLKVNSHDLAKAAKEVGTFGAQMGQLASELQRNREAANGGGKHRSPLEVVLEGLTARRSGA